MILLTREIVNKSNKHRKRKKEFNQQSKKEKPKIKEEIKNKYRILKCLQETV